MAQKFVKAATKQLAPVYAAQEKAISSQVPAIQNLYNTLIQGLEQSSAQQLETGVTGIVEDASRRGVLRSTLPVDARQTLQGQLSQALLQGRGQLESQRAGDIAGINERLGSLRIQRTGNIADLARALETRDLEERQFQLQKLQANREYQLQQQQLAMSRSRGSGGGRSRSRGSTRAPTASQRLQADASALAGGMAKQAGGDGFVSPDTYLRAKNEWVRAGYTSQSFDNRFSNFRNPANPYYKVG